MSQTDRFVPELIRSQIGRFDRLLLFHCLKEVIFMEKKKETSPRSWQELGYPEPGQGPVLTPLPGFVEDPPLDKKPVD